MLRRLRLLRAKTTPPGQWCIDDHRGSLDLDVAAEHLGLEPRYAKSLFMPLNKSYKVIGPSYPCDRSRRSRPGFTAAALQERRPSQLAKYIKADMKAITTE